MMRLSTSIALRHGVAFILAFAVFLAPKAIAQAIAPVASDGKAALKPLAVVVATTPEKSSPGKTAALLPLPTVLPAEDPSTHADGTIVLQPLPAVVVPAPATDYVYVESYPLIEFLPAKIEPAVDLRGTLGSLAPTFSLQTPQGQTVTLPDATRHQPMVLLFWPSWCPYSRALQPYVQSIWQDYRDHGVTVWTINIEETRDPVAVMKERDLNFPLLVSGNAVADQFGVRLMPAVLVIDGQNHIVYKMHEKTISPIDAAKQIRATLNGLLGDKAVALPTEYPKAYDLHLLSLEALNLRMTPIAIPQSEWEPWMDAYLATLRPEEYVSEIPAKGPIANGKQAITFAREIWSKKYGVEQTIIQAPYRSYRIDNHWVVLASGEVGASTTLGEGFIAVLEVDSGRAVRVVPRQ